MSTQTQTQTVENEYFSETLEALRAAGNSLVDLVRVSVTATAHTIELGTHAAVITVDTVDYGLKSVLDVMPHNGAEAVQLGKDLFAELEKKEEEQK